MSEAILKRLLRGQATVSEEFINYLVQKMANRNRPLDKSQEDELCEQLVGIEVSISNIPDNNILEPHRCAKKAVAVWNKFCRIEEGQPMDDDDSHEDEELEVPFKKVKIEDDQPKTGDESKKRKADDDEEEEEKDEQSKKMKSEESSSNPGGSNWFSSN